MAYSVLIHFGCSLSILVAHVAIVYIQHQRFLSTTIALQTEKTSLLIIYNALAAGLILAYSTTIKLFLGTLRTVERELLIEKFRQYVLESLGFLLLFSPSIGGKSVDQVKQFTAICGIVVLKVFHAALEIRVDHMFELSTPDSGAISRGFMFLLGLFCLDNFLILRCISLIGTLADTYYSWIVFETIVCLLQCVFVLFKFYANVLDASLERGFHSKREFIFNLELVFGFCTLLTFVCFMAVFVLYNNSNEGIYYLLAEVIRTARVWYQKLVAFQKYRRLMNNIQECFPDASLEEIEAMDSCIICRDDLYLTSKKLKCGHVYHFACLKTWLLQQQNCPLCRASVDVESQKKPKKKPPLPVYRARGAPRNPPPATDLDPTPGQGQAQTQPGAEARKSWTSASFTEQRTYEHAQRMIVHYREQADHSYSQLESLRASLLEIQSMVSCPEVREAFASIKIPDLPQHSLPQEPSPN